MGVNATSIQRRASGNANCDIDDDECQNYGKSERAFHDDDLALLCHDRGSLCVANSQHECREKVFSRAFQGGEGVETSAVDRPSIGCLLEWPKATPAGA